MDLFQLLRNKLIRFFQGAARDHWIISGVDSDELREMRINIRKSSEESEGSIHESEGIKTISLE